jgi:Zn-dependent peptidase ImmA (M78 family)
MENIADISDVLQPAVEDKEASIKGIDLRSLYQDKKERLGLSDRKIQLLLGMDNKTLKPILDGTAKQVNFISLIKLANFIGLSVNAIAGAYVQQLSAQQIGEIQEARDAGYILEHFDIKTLSKCGFIDSQASGKEISNRIRVFFGYDSLYNYTEQSLTTLFSRTKRTSSDLMREFWVQSAFCQFKGINNPNEYDRQRLLDLLPRIKPYTRSIEKGLISVLKALFLVGVTVIYQPKLSKEQVRGATMIVNDKPCIVLSDINDNYPTLWFALLHELYHVLFDYDAIRSQIFHITSDVPDMYLVYEERADKFAEEYLLNESKLKFISGYIDSKFVVTDYAAKWNIHPSIIYATYCYHNSSKWKLYQRYIPSMKKALEYINTNPFDKETLQDSIFKVKEIYNI